MADVSTPFKSRRIASQLRDASSGELDLQDLDVENVEAEVRRVVMELNKGDSLVWDSGRRSHEAKNY